MNQDTKENLWLFNKLNKCRCCFERFDHNDEQIKITDIIEEQFLELTQIELKPSPNFSNIVCSKCTSELQSISNFRLNLILKQQQLYEFVITSEYEIQDVVFDPVDYLSETQTTEEFVDNYQFESQFEAIKSPEVPVLSKTTEDETPNKRYFLRERRNTQDSAVETSGRKTPVKRKPVNKKITACGIDLKKSTNFKYNNHGLHMKENKYFCDFCSHSSMSVLDMIKHTRTHSSAFKRKDGKEKKTSQRKITWYLESKRFSCDHCGFGPVAKNDLTKHMPTHIPEKFREILSCDKCKFFSISEVSLQSHKRRIHGPNGKMLFTCHCGQILTTRYGYICIICNEAFDSRFALEEHKVIHKGKRETECKECGKRFFTQRMLRLHSIYHTTPKFNCTFDGCKRQFFHHIGLLQHKKSHIAQRDFACQFCDKEYFLKSQLKQHIFNSHEKGIFVCELPNCNSQLRRKSSYRIHVMSNHNEVSPEKKIKLLKKIKEMKANL